MVTKKRGRSIKPDKIKIIKKLPAVSSKQKDDYIKLYNTI